MRSFGAAFAFRPTFTTFSASRGIMNWRAAPAASINFAAGTTLCDAHYRGELAAIRKNVPPGLRRVRARTAASVPAATDAPT